MPALTPLPPGAPRYERGFCSRKGVTVAYVEDWAKEHVLEGDGLCPLLYEYLHKSIKGRENPLSTVLVPETVVFDHNFPRAWYAYDPENKEIAKRPGKMLDAQTMYNVFSKPLKGCEIVAQFIHNTVTVEDAWSSIISAREKKAEVYKGQKLTYVEFFTAETLHSFLFLHSRKPDGVLQKFVVPKSEGTSRRNSQLQAVWSPLMTTVYRRVNRHRIDDNTVSIPVRASTYDGPSYYSEEGLVGDESKAMVDTICRNIVDHVYFTEKKRISRLNLFLKVDDDNKMWLMWCSSIRISADTLNPTFLRVPVMFSIRTEITNDGSTTVDQLRTRQQRQRHLLDLDNELFRVSHDYQFALAMNAQHKRQAKALGLKGLKGSVPLKEGSKDPRKNPRHPLHESFRCIYEPDAAGFETSDPGKPFMNAETQRLDGSQSSTLTVNDFQKERVLDELVALAMDAWYAIYSTTLSDTPHSMPTAHVELAEPVMEILTHEELTGLVDILGLTGQDAAVEASSAAGHSNVAGSIPSRHFRAPCALLGPARRLDKPSAQVEADVRQFFARLFQYRGDDICKACLSKYEVYFEDV